MLQKEYSMFLIKHQQVQTFLETNSKEMTIKRKKLKKALKELLCIAEYVTPLHLSVFV